MSLWRHPDFLKLWAGQTISLLGNQVTGLALALTAAIVLQATPAEMGVIGTLNVLPFVFFGLPAGLWVDRVQRRWVLVGTDLARNSLMEMASWHWRKPSRAWVVRALPVC